MLRGRRGGNERYFQQAVIWSLPGRLDSACHPTLASTNAQPSTLSSHASASTHQNSISLNKLRCSGFDKCQTRPFHRCRGFLRCAGTSCTTLVYVPSYCRQCPTTSSTPTARVTSTSADEFTLDFFSLHSSKLDLEVDNQLACLLGKAIAIATRLPSYQSHGKITFRVHESIIRASCPCRKHAL